MQLAVHDDRVDDGADVVHRPIPDDRGAAGFRIDLELADMGAVAEREARRVVGGLLVEAGFHGFQRKVVRHIGGLGD